MEDEDRDIEGEGKSGTRDGERKKHLLFVDDKDAVVL